MTGKGEDVALGLVGQRRGRAAGRAARIERGHEDVLAAVVAGQPGEVHAVGRERET
ncbi:MAG: hypothetical protein ABI277_19380 [Burkholderiaceae bacterium]